jgi:hypothetical protein
VNVSTKGSTNLLAVATTVRSARFHRTDEERFEFVARFFLLRTFF